MGLIVHQCTAWQATGRVLKPELSLSFRSKICGGMLPILIHPFFSRGNLFGPDGLTSRGKRYSPKLDEKQYYSFLRETMNYLKTLKAFAIMAEVGEGAEEVPIWLEALNFNAEVLLVETAKFDPLPLLPFPLREITHDIKRVIGGRVDMLETALKEHHLDWQGNFQPAYDGHLYLDTPEDFMTEEENKRLAIVFQLASYRKFAWLLNKNGVKAVELMGELLHMKQKDGKTYPYGCFHFAASYLNMFLEVGYQRALGYPGYQYTEIVPPGTTD
jgi:hypothetical protein